MLELFQYEACPDCARVRQKLWELTLDFVVRQVPHEAALRNRLELATGQQDVPTLVDPEQRMVVTEADDIIAYLEETYGQRKVAP